MIEMGVRDEPGGGSHERPRLSAQIETDFELGNTPIGLDRRARVALDRQFLVNQRFDRKIVDHEVARCRKKRNCPV